VWDAQTEPQPHTDSYSHCFVVKAQAAISDGQCQEPVDHHCAAPAQPGTSLCATAQQVKIREVKISIIIIIIITY